MGVSQVWTMVYELHRGDVPEYFNQKGLSQSFNQGCYSIHGPARSTEEATMFVILHQGGTLLLSISNLPRHTQNTSMQKGNEDNVVKSKSLS
jgi:hypothetical protein